jgi:hypothetical protein
MMALDPQRHRKAERGRGLEVSDSDVNIDEDDDINDFWIINCDLRNLEQYLNNNGLTFTPDDPTSISEVLNRFHRNGFLEILVEQSNLYHAQNADKYKNSSKLLVWNTDIKKFLATIIYGAMSVKIKLEIIRAPIN